MSYIDALKADIDAKKKELADVLALIEKSKGLMAEVEHMEQILLFATSPTKKTKVKSKRASAWTPERRWRKRRKPAMLLTRRASQR